MFRFTREPPFDLYPEVHAAHIFVFFVTWSKVLGIFGAKNLPQQEVKEDPLLAMLLPFGPVSMCKKPAPKGIKSNKIEMTYWRSDGWTTNAI